MKATEIEYRLDQGLSPTDSLSPQDIKQISDVAAKRLGTHLKNVAKSAKKVRDNLNAYYNAPSLNVQQQCLRDIQTSAANLGTTFSDAGLASVCTPQPNMNVTPTSILQATHNSNDERMNIFAVSPSSEYLYSLYERNKGRLNPFKQFQNRRFIQTYERMAGRGRVP